MKMGDLELSLDDIIKKKLGKTGVTRGRNNAGNTKKPIRRIPDSNNRVTKNQNLSKTAIKTTRTNSKIVRGQGPQPGVGDARLKIIQKQRQKMTDARDKLGHIAKQTDARLRLMKIRERQRAGLSGGMLRLQSRSSLEQPLLQRIVQRANSFYDEELMDYPNDAPYVNRNFGDRAILEDKIFNYGYGSRQEAPVLFRTVENDMPLNRLFEQDKSMYTWTKPLPISDIPSIPVSRAREVRGNASNWDIDEMPIVITKKLIPQETVGILKRTSSGAVFDGPTVKIVREPSPPPKNKAPVRTLSERFCQEGNLSAQKINLLKAKLDASYKGDKNNSAEIQPPLGYRIVVSNLVPSVTHEDVKELFEDIGELISSKVVRPGTAEVVYKLQKDAVKAVDVYHNRQLDGQPMKCLLVNNKSGPSAASKVVKGTDRKLGKSVVQLDMTAFRKALHKKSTS